MFSHRIKNIFIYTIKISIFKFADYGVVRSALIVSQDYFFIDDERDSYRHLIM